MIKASTMVELLSKIYQAEGWQRSSGESKLARAKTVYDLKIDHKANKFTAIRRTET